MLVKVFGNKGGGSPSASLNYLKNKEGDHAKLLKGDIELSKKIAESLDFKTTYTVGCLSFEEEQIPDEQKREIMDRFEKTFFTGLDDDQYNITWIQHTDKDRIELNFFIPNVELKSGKRLQPYYDKTDRPLAENFKQVINHEYSLSDPNAPEKEQTLITQQYLPKEKKEALKAIDSGLMALAAQGVINNRDDVIQALEKSGFEIARITKKNISIKTEGQNLRLKGAFYDETFRISENFSATITERTREYKDSREDRYRTARERLESAVTRRYEYNRERYSNRENEINKTHDHALENTLLHHAHSDVDHVTSMGIHNVGLDKRISTNENVETLSSSLQREQQTHQINPVQNRKINLETLCKNGQKLFRSDVGKQLQNHSDSGVTTHDRNRITITERIKELVRTAFERTTDFITKISRSGEKEQANYDAVQSNNDTIQCNDETIQRGNEDVKAFESIVETLEEKNEMTHSQGMTL